MLVQKDGALKKSHLRDTAPENCTGYQLVPQIMAGNSNDFLFLAKYLTDLGYQEINWNLGCPYPMVTGKGMGSGLLPYPEKISEILDQSLPQLKCRISVKLRSGLNSPEEIFQVIPVLNQYPLSEVILHPRIKQLLPEHLTGSYSKGCSFDPHPLVQWDIGTMEDFQRLVRI